MGSAAAWRAGAAERPPGRALHGGGGTYRDGRRNHEAGAGRRRDDGRDHVPRQHHHEGVPQEPEGDARSVCRRLVPFGRPRRDASRRLREDQGPLEGHHHLGGREHLLARGRGRALPPSRRDGGGRGRAPGFQMGRDAVRIRGTQARRQGLGRRADRVLPRADGEIQGAARHRLRRAAQDLDRQDPEVRAARKGEVDRRHRYMSALPQSEQPILLREDRDGVCTLTLNRPQQMNLLTGEMLAALQKEFDSIKGDRSVRVVVLAGAGKGFCAGHDLKEIKALRELPKIEALFGQCSRMMQTIPQLPQPVIARVHGAAAAAGCQLVAQCDLAIAADVAKFVTSGVTWGFFCSTPGVAVGRNLQRKHATEMLLTGEPISAERALEWGLVNRVVPLDQLDAEVSRLAALLASKPPATVAAGKRAFYQQMDLGLEQAYTLASGIISASFAYDEGRARMDAFIEKRPPPKH